MKLNYFYRQTKKIKYYLNKLEVLRQVINILPQSEAIIKNLRRQSLLKSSLYSARIEGNRLKLEDISKTSRSKEKLEISNILKAAEWLFSTQAPKKLNSGVILRLHKFVLTGISSGIGTFRTEPSAIFNQAGVAIYLAPPVSEISALLKRFINKINKSKDPGPVKAALTHFAFEKIHPFLDGNGRVGRLLSLFVLKNSGFGFRGLVTLEEYLDKNRQSYYDFLLANRKDITDFVDFFLEALYVQAQKAIRQTEETKASEPENLLLPRRREILEIIKDHKMVSFDFIRRRFIAVPESSLHYDLKQLIKSGFVIKLGSTRGVNYSLKNF